MRVLADDKDDMSTFGDDLIQSLTEALAHAKGEGPAIVHTPLSPRKVPRQAKLTQAQMARTRRTRRLRTLP